MENRNAKELSKKLIYRKKSAFEKYGEDERENALEYAKDYVEFLNNSKTERDAVAYSVSFLEKHDFKPYTFGMQVYQGDRFYVVNRNKSLIAFVIGSKGVADGFRILASHIDSPRLDLKQHPVFEEGGISYFKTHYYGGLRKYQWTTIPLALHGVICLNDGTSVNVCIGEKEDDPVFCITDLLPHLGKEQGEKKLKDAFVGEGLNAVTCASPFTVDGVPEEIDNSVKLNLLGILNEKYGITEEDFTSAELCFVPAGKARDVGFDRTLIGAYGHDDKVCAYPSLTAMLDNLDGENSVICVLADKEETGSDGPTGMQGRLMIDIINSVSASFGENGAAVRARSRCLSADVSSAYDPNYPEVFEKNNAALISHGVAISKYTGSGGKYSTNDSPAEYMGKIRELLDKYNVLWQTAELGKIDAGGGGTVAKYISKFNIDTIDIGVPVLSMHAPFEMISKFDLYSAHKAFSAFCED